MKMKGQKKFGIALGILLFLVIATSTTLTKADSLWVKNETILHYDWECLEWTVDPIVESGYFCTDGRYYNDYNYSEEIWEEVSPSKVVAQTGHLEWNIYKDGMEKDLEITYENIGETSTEFCVEIPDTYKTAIGLTDEIPLSKEKGDLTIKKASLDAKNNRECFTVEYKELVEGLEFKLGLESITVNTSTDEGSGSRVSWKTRVFYDPNNERWHILYIDSASDIRTISSADAVTWDDGVTISAGTYDYDDFDCYMVYDDTDTRLHCVYSDAGGDFINYRRCNLTGSGSYIECETEETPFDASDYGWDSSDDLAYSGITLDNDNCVIIITQYKNYTNPDDNDYKPIVIKEASPCGDGDFDMDDIETGFPKSHILSKEPGYDTTIPTGIRKFNDGSNDAMLFWFNSTDFGEWILHAAFFNGTTDTTGTEITLLEDTEEDPTFWDSVIVGERTITFSMEDGTNDLDALVLTSKLDTTPDSYDTGLNVPHVGWGSGLVTAVVDTRAILETIWVFAVDDTDNQDIFYTNSTDGGETWATPVLWQDEAGVAEVKYLSAYFDNTTCNIGVTWLNGSSSPFSVMFDNFTTGGCKPKLEINYTAPTDIDNAIITDRNNTYINLSIVNYTAIDTVKIEWNGTNITLYDDSLVLALNFNNNTDDWSKYENVDEKGAEANCSDIDGKFNGGCEFRDDAASIIKYGDESNLQITDAITISAWVWVDSGLGTVVGWAGESDKYWFAFNQNEGGGNTRIYWYLEGVNNLYSGYFTSTDNWHYITVSYDKDAGSENQRAYFDGVLIANATDTAQIGASTANLSIGNTETDRYPFDGYIDEVRIWNRSLSDEEILATYKIEMGKYYLNMTDQAEDTYTYYGWINDTNGNSNQTETRTITFGEGGDTTNPSLTVSSPTNTTLTSSNISITYLVSDNIAVDVCWVINVTDNISLPDCRNTSINVTDGSYTGLQVWVNDSSGNYAYEEINFSVAIGADTCTPTTNWIIQHNCTRTGETDSVDNLTIQSMGSLILNGGSNLTVKCLNITATTKGFAYNVSSDSSLNVTGCDFW